MTIADIPSARQRLKAAARLIERHLSDLHLIFDRDLQETLGPDGTQFADFELLQEKIPALNDFTPAQLRRTILYDAKDTLELHPELDQVRRLRPFSEQEAVERMLFVDDIDISGHEDDPTAIFHRLLLPFPNVADSPATNANPTAEPGQDQESLNQQTVIRPYGYKPTRFFQGFCYVEFPSLELTAQMSNRILSRDNSVRVMPMKQWRRLESEYLSRKKQSP